MKRISISLFCAFISTLCFAQFNVGTSTQEKDIFGNPTGTVTHRDAYGRTIGTSTQERDIFGNSTGTTIHRNSFGGTTGTSTQEKDIFGNSTGTTRQNSNNSNTSIWSW